MITVLTPRDKTRNILRKGGSTNASAFKSSVHNQISEADFVVYLDGSKSKVIKNRWGQEANNNISFREAMSLLQWALHTDLKENL